MLRSTVDLQCGQRPQDPSEHLFKITIVTKLVSSISKVERSFLLFLKCSLADVRHRSWSWQQRPIGWYESWTHISTKCMSQCGDMSSICTSENNYDWQEMSTSISLWQNYVLSLNYFADCWTENENKVLKVTKADRMTMELWWNLQTFFLFCMHCKHKSRIMMHNKWKRNNASGKMLLLCGYTI